MPENVQITVTTTPQVRAGLQAVARDRGLTVTALVEHLAAGRLTLVPPDTLELYQRLAMADNGADELRRIARALEVLAVSHSSLNRADADAGPGSGSSEGS